MQEEQCDISYSSAAMDEDAMDCLKKRHYEIKMPFKL